MRFTIYDLRFTRLLHFVLVVVLVIVLVPFCQAADPAGLHDPTPVNFWMVIGAFLLISTGALNVITIFVLLSNRKEKREVNFAFEPASKAEFEKHIELNRAEHSVIYSKFSGVEDAASRRGAALYEKIDAVRKELHTATTDQTTKLTEKIEDVQTEMPSRIIALLRNTGVIK